MTSLQPPNFENAVQYAFLTVIAVRHSNSLPGLALSHVSSPSQRLSRVAMVRPDTPTPPLLVGSQNLSLNLRFSFYTVTSARLRELSLFTAQCSQPTVRMWRSQDKPLLTEKCNEIVQPIVYRNREHIFESIEFA